MRKEYKRKKTPNIDDLLYADVWILATHKEVRYMISKDFLMTGPNLAFVGTLENLQDNITMSCMITDGVPMASKVPGNGPVAKKKFMALLKTMNIQSDFDQWKIYRESIRSAAESIAE